MKKIAKILVVFVGVIFLAGCDTNDLFGSINNKSITKCTLDSDQSANGYKLNSEYNIYATGNVVTSVKTTEVVTSDKEEILKYFQNTLNTQYEAANKSYGGYSFDIKKSDNKITSNVTIDYNKMNLKKFVQDNASMKSYINKDNKITLSGAKKLYESLGATCK